MYPDHANSWQLRLIAMSDRFCPVLIGSELLVVSSSMFDRGEVKTEEKNALNSSALWTAVFAVTPSYDIFDTLLSR